MGSLQLSNPPLITICFEQTAQPLSIERLGPASRLWTLAIGTWLRPEQELSWKSAPSAISFQQQSWGKKRWTKRTRRTVEQSLAYPASTRSFARWLKQCVKHCKYFALCKNILILTKSWCFLLRLMALCFGGDSRASVPLASATNGRIARKKTLLEMWRLWGLSSVQCVFWLISSQPVLQKCKNKTINCTLLELYLTRICVCTEVKSFVTQIQPK